MLKTIHLLANSSMLAVATRKPLGGVEHLVVPVVAIKEGVLNNLLYTAEEIQTFPEAWNGVPVPVNHPTTNGTAVSANSTVFEETTNIGRFYGAHYDEAAKSLKGEIWINIQKAESLGHSSIVERLEGGEIMEVSTGLFSAQVDEAGEFNGKSYAAIAINYRPDHLAILPDSKGACSIDDGCGAMRTNCEGKKACTCGTTKVKSNQEDQKFWDKFKNFFGLKSNELSHDDIRSRLRGKIVEVSGEDPWPWVVEVYETNFIYELADKLYKRNYSLDSTTGEVVFLGDETQVFVKTEYLPLTTTNMKQNGTTGSIVDAIIANGKAEITAEERTALEAMDQGLLAKVLANTQGATPAKPELKVLPDVTANALSPDDRALLNQLRANEETRISGLRKTVEANYPNLGAEVVANMDSKAIESLANAIPQGANRAPAGGAPQTNAASDEDEPYVPVDVFAEMVKPV